VVPYKPPDKTADYTQWMDIYQRLQKERIIMVSNFIDETEANKLIAMLLYLERESAKDGISIYFNCPGALQKPAWALFDTLRQVPFPVTTINMGLATGMGAMLCAAGTVGRRFCFPNARFLVQKTGIEDVFRGQATDIVLEVKENMRLNKRLVEAIAGITGNTEEQINKDLKRDFYLSSDEAVRYGWIDQVILPNRKVLTPFTTDLKGNVNPKKYLGFGEYEAEKFMWKLMEEKKQRAAAAAAKPPVRKGDSKTIDADSGL